MTCLGVDASAWVGRVVHQNGAGVVVDQRLHVVEISFPLLIRLEDIKAVG